MFKALHLEANDNIEDNIANIFNGNYYGSASSIVELPHSGSFDYHIMKESSTLLALMLFALCQGISIEIDLSQIYDDNSRICEKIITIDRHVISEIFEFEGMRCYPTPTGFVFGCSAIPAEIMIKSYGTYPSHTDSCSAHSNIVNFEKHSY